MQGKIRFGLSLFVITLAMLGILLLGTPNAAAQGPKPGSVRAPSANAGTAFTYQGQLKSGGVAVNGTCAFNFGLWDASTLGNQIGVTQPVPSLAVTNGLFTTPIDFGANAFNGDARWLAIAVNCGSGLTVLNQRQALTPAPMAFALPGLYTQQNGTSPNIIGGFSFNVTSPTLHGATISGGGINSYPNVITGTGNYAVIGGGTNNTASADYATIGGGDSNRVSNSYATIGGGKSNVASGWSATVGGGNGNTASSFGSTVSGGNNNAASSFGSTVGGGDSNITGNNFATVGGGANNTASNQFATVGGGNGNTASGIGSFVGGGGYDGTFYGSNQASANASTIVGGYGNVISATGTYAFIGGGYQNTVSNSFATVNGGNSNTASGQHAAVAGGYGNNASGLAATIGGGNQNIASDETATVGGGDHNTASGFASTIPGGSHNAATMFYTFAAGLRAKANHTGAFVWGDNTLADFASTGINQFLIRANGGMGVGTNAPAAQLHVSSSGGDSMPQMRIDQMNLNDATRLRMTVGGNVSQRWDVAATSAYLTFYSGLAGNVLTMMPNDPTNYMLMGNGASLTAGGQWTNASDRNIKANFQSVDSQAVLSQVANLPITSWNYKTEGSSIRHIGPMAQDFSAAFGLGNDDKSIGTVDEGGVALVAIQGLAQENQELKSQVIGLTSQIATLKSQNEKQQGEFETRLSTLEQNKSINNNGVNVTFDLNGFVIGALLLGVVMLYRARK